MRFSLYNAVISVFVIIILIGGLVLFIRTENLSDIRNAESHSEPFPLWAENIARINGISALAGGIGILSGVLASRTLSRPIDELAQAAQKIGAGDLSVRTTAQGSEEINILARSFNEMAESLEKDESLRSNLLADVSHELRTPLTVLEGNLRAMLDGVYTLNDDEVANLYAQVRHLIHLVEDLRLLAQAEARQLPLTLQPTDAATLIREVVEFFTPQADESGIALVLDNFPVSFWLKADSARLRQILYNLLANALRHTPRGGTVSLRTETEAESARLVLTDTGEGISPDDLPHIFDRFYRADKSRARDSGGSGLGLAIVKALVEAQGGSIRAESGGAGQGSRFILGFRRVIPEV
jgi:two-component system OmpR family sensor kinase/two-component system sensor histidine kinase BaeS